MRDAPSLRQLSLDAAMAEVGRAWSWLKAGDPISAARVLGPLIAREPAFAPAREMMAYTLQMRGDFAGAEKEIRQALALDVRQPAFHAALGGLLRLKGDLAGAEGAFRAALELERRFLPAVEGFAGLALQVGRPDVALAVLEPVLPAGRQTPPSIVALQVQALRGLRRPEEARDALAGLQGAGVDALLSAVSEDLGEVGEAEAAARRALAADADDPELWSRLGRMLQARGDLGGAEEAARQALARVPEDTGAHAAVAETVWMRTGDAASALADLDAALHRRPTLSLITLKSRLMRDAGRPDEAYELLAHTAAREPANPGLRTAAAAAAAAAGRLPEMLVEAEAAAALRPDDHAVRRGLADALVRNGEFAAAGPVLADLLAAAPEDQEAITLQALAWRGLGDDRYGEVYAYDRLVRPYEIEPPAGWPSLDGFLADLTATLKPMHRFDIHPLGQSLRGGTQTSHNLALSPDPVIKAFFAAVRAPIERYIAEARPAGRREEGHRIEAAWSVNLRPNGFHVSHMHPDGWISSAFHVEVPESVGAPGRPGWLQFGDPGGAMTVALEPDHFVRPKPGTLVLFPSYMLHGTRQFGGGSNRLTVAFDVVRPRP